MKNLGISRQIQTGVTYKRNPDLGKERLYLKESLQVGVGVDGGEMIVMG